MRNIVPPAMARIWKGNPIGEHPTKTVFCPHHRMMRPVIHGIMTMQCYLNTPSAAAKQRLRRAASRASRAACQASARLFLMTISGIFSPTFAQLGRNVCKKCKQCGTNLMIEFNFQNSQRLHIQFSVAPFEACCANHRFEPVEN